MTRESRKVNLGTVIFIVVFLSALFIVLSRCSGGSDSPYWDSPAPINRFQ
jgi:hypothetical protein